MGHYKLGTKGRKSVHIDERMHQVVTLYVRKQGITITEAVHNIMRLGIAQLIKQDRED